MWKEFGQCYPTMLIIFTSCSNQTMHISDSLLTCLGREIRKFENIEEQVNMNRRDLRGRGRKERSIETNL